MCMFSTRFVICVLHGVAVADVKILLCAAADMQPAPGRGDLTASVHSITCSLKMPCLETLSESYNM